MTLIVEIAKARFRKVPNLRSFRMTGNVRSAGPVKRCLRKWVKPKQWMALRTVCRYELTGAQKELFWGIIVIIPI
jgi:hypothetical protein